MSKVAGQPPLSNALIKVVDLLVESEIRIDAMEQILVRTNPVAYELYLGTIENLRAQKAAELKKYLLCKAQVKAERRLTPESVSRQLCRSDLSFKDEHLPVVCLREPERARLFLPDG